MNINKLMKQAQEMQKKMQEMQEKMGELEVVGAAGGGMVQVTLSGKGEARKVQIDPKAIDPEDTEMLEDLLVAAINDARRKVEETTNAEMANMTSGLPIPPGMKLPF